MSPSYPSASSPWTPGWVAAAIVLGVLLASAGFSLVDLLEEGRARHGETTRLGGLQRLHGAVAGEFAALLPPAAAGAPDEARERAGLERVCAQFRREAQALEAWNPPPSAVQRAGDGLTTVCNMQAGGQWRSAVDRALAELQTVMVEQGQLANEAREDAWWRRMLEVGLLTSLLAASLAGLIYWRRTGSHPPPPDLAPRGPSVASSPPQWMRAAIEASPEGILMVDAGGEIRAANPSAEQTLGAARGGLVGQRATDFVPAYRDIVDSTRGEWLQTPIHPREETGTEDEKRDISWYRREDPFQVFTILMIHPVRNGAATSPAPLVKAAVAPAAASLGPDEVDPESLQQLENQILLVTGYGEVALSNLAADDPIRPDIEQLARAGARAALLCREATMRPLTVDKRPVQLNTFLKGFEQRLRSLAAEGTEILRRADAVAGTVETDAELLEQTLLALALHAAPSIREPVLIRLATSLGRIEMSLHTRGAVNLQWQPGPAIKPQRAQQWLAALDAKVEHELADRGGHRFRIQLPRQSPLALLAAAPPSAATEPAPAAEPSTAATTSAQ